MNKSNVNTKSATASKKVGGGASVKQGNLGLSSKSSTECECTYCHEFGHSASEQYCPAMKAAAFFVYEAAMNAKNKKSTAVSGGAKRPKPVGGRGGGASVAAVPKTVSKFAALSMGDSDSESDSETDSDSSSENVVESVVDEYPVLGMTIGGGGGVGLCGGGGMSYRAAIMKSSKPAAVATVTDGGMTSLKLSGCMKRVRFEDLVSSSAGGVSMAAPAPAPAHAVVYTLPLPPLLVEVKKPWKHNRFVSDWNASSSDDDSDCD
jgi:hypothetical protein